MPHKQLDSVVCYVRRVGEASATPELTDAHLLERYTSCHDEDAFAALVRRHGRLVRSVCRHVLHREQDIDDAFQVTFLVFAVKAASIRKAVSVASWLHGVAYRTAMNAKRAYIRRCEQTGNVGGYAKDNPPREAALHEVQAILDDEVQRLPEKYRAPFVLCCLEGKSKAEAAEELGWKEGTVSGRVAQARKQLQGRLARRGVRLAAALSAAELSRTEAPAALVKCTIKAALCFAAGKAADLVSAEVAAATQGVLRTMFTTRLKGATAVLVAVGLLAGAVTAAHQAFPTATGAAPQAAPKAVGKKGAGARKPDESKYVLLGGRVLDSDGKPVDRAKVWFHLPLWEELHPGADRPPTTQVTTGSDGRFRVRVPRSQFQGLQEHAFFSHPTISAAAPGYGPAWVALFKPDAVGELTLTLTRDDVPINGRVLDTQGRPVKGVTVRVLALFAAPDEKLASWYEALRVKKDNTIIGQYLTRRLEQPASGVPATVTTDGAGRFRLNGVGRQRVVELLLEGATIQTDGALVMTAAKPSLQVPFTKRRPEAGTATYYGARFDFAAAPTKPVFGTVRDKDTGKPLAGITIRNGRGSLYPVQATSDAKGEYRLVGLPRGAGGEVEAVALKGQPYIYSRKKVGGGPGVEPTRVDFELKRGVVIRGKVTDKQTGKPCRAQVEYYAFFDNPHIKDVPGGLRAFRAHFNPVTTREDGSFTVVGLPGRGLLAVRAPEDRFVAACGADKIKGLEGGMFETEPRICVARSYHTLVEVNPDKGAQTATYDVTLDPGRTVAGTVVDPEGKPLEGVQVAGLKGMLSGLSYGERLAGSAFRATGLDPRQPRGLFFYDAQKRLGAAVLVRGDEKKPIQVRLRPCGAVVGRILDADGDPRPGLRLSVSVDGGQFGRDQPIGDNSRPPVTTDKEGRFRIDLIPGVKYTAEHLFGGLALESGQTKDLGSVTVKEVKKQ
jgi:RNA polymerase sigma factor (sigma-70 family)